MQYQRVPCGWCFPAYLDHYLKALCHGRPKGVYTRHYCGHVGVQNKNPVGVEPFSNVKGFFCSNYFALDACYVCSIAFFSYCQLLGLTCYYTELQYSEETVLAN